MTKIKNKKYTLSSPKTFADQVDEWRSEALPANLQRLGLKIVLMRFDGIISDDQADRLLKDLNPAIASK